MATLGAIIAGIGFSGQAAAATAAARPFHTVLEDDDESLFSPSTLPAFIGTLRWLGVDELRVSAEWKLEAPDPYSRAAPRDVDLSDPRAYDGSPAMQSLDRAVRAAAAGGLGVIIDPSFSAPLWATSDRRPASVAGDPWFNTDIDVRELAQWEGRRGADRRHEPERRRCRGEHRGAAARIHPPAGVRRRGVAADHHRLVRRLHDAAR